MKIFNLNSDEWDRTRDREGWRAKGARLSANASAVSYLARPCPRSGLATSSGPTARTS